MGDKLYTLDVHEGLFTLTMNRPPANALNLQFALQLAEAVESLEFDGRLGALVLTGAGSCFSAGLDLKELAGYNRKEQDAMLGAFNRLALALYSLRRPTVAAVNGHAIAGGFILALCCDLRIGPEGVGRYGLTEGQVGVAFPAGALVTAIEELGPAAARRLLLGAQTYGPQEALADGALDALVPPEEVLSRAQAEAQARMALPESYGAIKHQMRLEALDRMRKAVRHGDRLEGRWLDEDIAARIAAILKK